MAADPNALLDKFTQILAYVGDEGAKDGYFLRYNAENPVYSIAIRAEPLTQESLADLVDTIKEFVQNDAAVEEVPEDILTKISELKELYNSSTTSENAKGELIEYMNEYSGNSGMRGGVRRKNKSMRKRANKKRKNKKTRKNHNKR
jgi:hypothetical protein